MGRVIGIAEVERSERVRIWKVWHGIAPYVNLELLNESILAYEVENVKYHVMLLIFLSC